MLQCTGAETSTIWKEEIKKLHDWMTSQDLYPELVTLIISELNNWRNNNTSTYTPINQHLQQAIVLVLRRIEGTLDGCSFSLIIVVLIVENEIMLYVPQGRITKY